MPSVDNTQNFNDDLKRMSEKLNAMTPPAIITPKQQPKTVEGSVISQILFGWGNKIKDHFGVLDDETKEMSRLRLEKCHSCYMRTKGSCDPRKSMTNNQTGEKVRGCGCNISAKSMSRTSRCPLGKWDK